MNKWSKTEIKLCQDIAKYWRKEIKSGDYILDKEGNACLVIRSYLKHGFIVIDQDESLSLDHSRVSTPIDKHTIPLLTLENCLEFLGKKVFDWDLDKEWDEDGQQTGKYCFWWRPTSEKPKDCYRIGKTPLETCLRAVLAILKENIGLAEKIKKSGGLPHYKKPGVRGGKYG